MKQRHVTCSFGILANKWRTFHISHISLSVTENTAQTCCLLHNLSHECDSDGCNDGLIVAILLSSQIPHRQLHIKFRKKNLQYYSIPYPFGIIQQTSLSMDAKRATLKCPVWTSSFNALNPELNPICYLLALFRAHHFLHVSRIRVKLLNFRLLMSYIYIWSTHSWCF
jgi:hypothetical protein